MRTSRWVRPHASRSAVPADIIDGIAVTTPTRTVCDCARLLPFEQGVVIADSALHRKLVTHEGLRAELDDAAGLKGVERARAVMDFADARSESVGESRSRVMFQSAPLPPMTLQHCLYDDLGAFVARVDFAISELKIAGEFDGRVKYGRELNSERDANDVVYEEKLREDRVRELGWQVVRWSWSDLEQPRIVIRRWQRAIERVEMLR